MKNKFSAVVAASGVSRRIGKDKIFLTLGDTTIIEKSIEPILESEIDEIIIVAGSLYDKVVSVFKREKKIKVLENKDYLSGQSASVRIGTNALSDDSIACFYPMSDQPFVSKEVYNEMIKSYRDGKIVVPVDRNRKRRGSPCLFSNKWYEDLKSISGDKGGRDIINSNLDSVIYFEIKDDMMFFDIDTIEDYNLAKKYFNKKRI